MMTKTLAVIICVSVIACANVGPVNGAVDWPQVRDKINDLKGIFTEVISNVRTILEVGNHNVTISILDRAVALGQEHFAKIDKLIEDQKLTEDQAKKELEEMKENLSKIKAEILSQLEKSDAKTAKKVEKAVEESKKKCEPTKEDLYALLRA